MALIRCGAGANVNSNLFPIEIPSGSYFHINELSANVLPFNGTGANSYAVIVGVHSINSISATAGAWTTVTGIDSDGNVTAITSGNIGTKTFDVSSYDFVTFETVGGSATSLSISVA